MHDDHLLTRLGTLTAMGGGVSALVHNPVLGALLTLAGGVVWEIARPALRAVGDHLLARWRHRRARTLTPPPPPPPSTPET